MTEKIEPEDQAAALVREREFLFDRLREENDRHDSEKYRLERAVADVEGRIRAVRDAGIDEDDLKIARRVLQVEGELKPGRSSSAARLRVVNDAIADLAAGAPTLRKWYFATKDYAQWSDQREDHPYGYGPKHGEVVFRVGLRDRGNRELLRREIGACVRALQLLADGRLTVEQLAPPIEDTDPGAALSRRRSRACARWAAPR